jgi:IS30 family transposase
MDSLIRLSPYALYTRGLKKEETICMKKSKLNLSRIRLQVARGFALGLSQEKIAKEIDSSQATISRLTRRPDFQKGVLRQKKG